MIAAPPAVDRPVAALRWCAVRGWLWPRLGPVSDARVTWRVRMDAACAHGRLHMAPDPRCSCGIAAVGDLRTALRLRRRLGLGRYLLVAVLLSGPTMVAEARPDSRGRTGYVFRARHARVLALCGGRRARRLAKGLGVPCLGSARGLAAYAAEHGAVLRPPDRPAAWWLRLLRFGLRLVFGLGFLLGLAVAGLARLRGR